VPADPRRVKELFVAALDLPDPAVRAAFLDRECGPDNELRQRLDRLLSVHDEAASAPVPPDATSDLPADPPTASHGPPEPTADHHPAPDEGTVIAGRYKLLQQIGEGGMGTVWMAEQLHPVRRKVAVKLVKEGMDSRRVLARFEAERQALALMDHPHIAKVLDAGATDQGRPYFVMELVKGVPLTRFCDDRRLTVPQRLELFQQICSAVQHAHQKGVIHRDLKPGNVLVESHDGRPVPKVIEFGLAKAVSELPLTDKSLFTAYGAVMGTPQYMAPEQASFNAVDVDTRADIYALGVILYELLTGSPPIPKDRLRAAALDEVLRVIREEDPPTPSHRLSTAEGTPSVAANRQTEPRKLGRLVRGDLDWIVMKALAKDRQRRYETASGFAADVGRFLADEPVLAGPPSAGYRLRKFVRRNRAAVLATAAVLLAVLTGAGVSAWQAVRATAAEKDARESARIADEEREKADATRQAAEAAADAERAANRRGYEAIKRLANTVFSRNIKQTTLTEGVSASWSASGHQLPESERPLLEALLGYYEAFTSQLGESREELEDQVESYRNMAVIRGTFGDHTAAASASRSALKLTERMVGSSPTDPKDRVAIRDAHVSLAEKLHRGGRHSEAMTHWGRAAELSPVDDEEFRLFRARGLAWAGLVDEAVAAIDALTDGGKNDDYNAACVIALASAACKNDPGRAEVLAMRAMKALRRTEAGWPFADDLKAQLLMLLKLDPDLVPIRDRPDFKALVAEVEEKYRRAHATPAVAPPPREAGR
jgi:serine/threonine protein kinase